MNPYLVPGLRAAPLVFARLAEMLPEGSLDRPTGPGRFTPREVLAHLADWEPIFRSRIETALATPGAAVPVYDEGERAVSEGYAEADPARSLATFAAERERTAALVESLTPAQFAQTVAHPERGTLTVADLAGMLNGHDLYHIEQLTEAVRGRSISTW